MITAFGRGRKSNLRVTDVALPVEVGGEQAGRDDVASLTFPTSNAIPVSSLHPARLPLHRAMSAKSPLSSPPRATTSAYSGGAPKCARTHIPAPHRDWAAGTFKTSPRRSGAKCACCSSKSGRCVMSHGALPAMSHGARRWATAPAGMRPCRARV
jgi:hypothetical protein